MENILEVVAERNRAYNLLETGETGEPGQRWAYNQLGLGYWRKCKEQHVPLYANPRLRRVNSFSGPWQHKYLRLMREKRLQMRNRALRRENKRYEVNSRMFPDADIELDLERFQKTLASSMKGPSNWLNSDWTTVGFDLSPICVVKSVNWLWYGTRLEQLLNQRMNNGFVKLHLNTSLGDGFAFSHFTCNCNFIQFILRIHTAPLQETYSEALPSQPQLKNKQLSNLWNGHVATRQQAQL